MLIEQFDGCRKITPSTYRFSQFKAYQDIVFPDQYIQIMLEQVE